MSIELRSSSWGKKSATMLAIWMTPCFSTSTSRSSSHCWGRPFPQRNQFSGSSSHLWIISWRARLSNLKGLSRRKWLSSLKLRLWMYFPRIPPCQPWKGCWSRWTTSSQCRPYLNKSSRMTTYQMSFLPGCSSYWIARRQVAKRRVTYWISSGWRPSWITTLT